MGYTKCWWPGCPSRPRQGLLFKYFPKDKTLAQQWQENIRLPRLPALPERNIAICEKHFISSCFETPREDGRKKLKEFVVPTIDTSCTVSQSRPRPILGDATNIISSSGTVLRTHPANGNCDEKVILQATISTGKENMSPLNDFEMPMEPSIKKLKACEAANQEQEKLISKLKEEKNQLTQMLEVMRKQRDDLKSELSMLGDSVTEAIQSVMDENEKDKKEIRHKMETRAENDAKKIERILADNAKEKTQFNSIKTELENKISKLTTSASSSFTAYHTLRKRYLSQQKVKARLQQIVDRKSWSPWLSKTQQKRLSRTTSRGMKWDPAAIRTGLILKMKCGISGYSAFVKKIPLLPSARTLQQSVQFIKFDSGLLHEILEILGVILKEFPDTCRDCILVVDEMAIAEGIRYCHSLKKFVGESTFPTHCGTATKALIFLLAGLSKRWKVTVAVYFTSKRSEREKNNESGEAFKKIISEIIVHAERSGAKVCSVGTDMGPDNLAMWKAFNVGGSQSSVHGSVETSFPNPASTGTAVHVLPDSIHLFKAIKVMLENNKTVKLPEDVVNKESLSSPIVNYCHIAELMEFEEQFELKVAFRLKPWNVSCSKHFSKMKVGTARAVLCHRTSVGLDLLAEDKSDPSYKTTAWFVELLNTFFELVSSRHIFMSFSHRNKTVYDKAVALINKVSYVFQHMSVGEKGHRKPCQRGVIVLCQSLINLVEYLLNERGYRYVLPGRFTSDCLENLISLVRLAQSVPNAVAVLQNLKVITLCQLSEAVVGSSYDYEESDSIVDMLEIARAKAVERSHATVYENLEELLDNPVPHLTNDDLSSVSVWEKNIIYDMAGSVIYNLKSSNITFCEACLSATKHKEQEPHAHSTVSRMKEYVHLRSDSGDRLLQIYVSDEVFKAILTAELTIRMFRLKAIRFKGTDVVNFFVDNVMYVWAESKIPSCHNLCRWILKYYVTSRLKEYGRKECEEIKEAKDRRNTVLQRNSKSTAQWESALQM